MHANLNAGSWSRVGLCSAFFFVTGCGLPLDLMIDYIRRTNPDMVSALQASGLADVIPATELNTCGPTPEISDLIPDCPLPGGACFTAACFAHDVCYSTCGTDQPTCDRAFFWDMVYLCDSATTDFWERDRCYSFAWIYFRAVQDYGGYYFPNTQDYVCALGDAWPIPPVTPASDSAKAMIGPPFADADDDLMPDDWELENGLDPQDATDAWLDYDQDGRINLSEYTHGGDPYTPDNAADASDPPSAR